LLEHYPTFIPIFIYPQNKGAVGQKIFVCPFV